MVEEYLKSRAFILKPLTGILPDKKWFVLENRALFYFSTLKEIFEFLYKEKFISSIPQFDWGQIEKEMKIRIALKLEKPFKDVTKFVNHFKS